MKRIALIATGFTLALSGAAHAVTIDFEGDAVGAQSNGFMSLDNMDVAFSDTSGADLVVADFGTQSRGQGLAVSDNDGSRLQMDFTADVKGLSLIFGGDDASVAGPNLIAVLQGFYNGSFAGETRILANGNSDSDQTITLGSTRIDQAFFWYADISGAPANLTEVVDNVIYEVAPVPVPAGLPLILSGLGGLYVLRRRKRSS